MYKLFLCLRYLRRRYIAYGAVAAVALCVAMLVIVVSVMNGFLDKVETAAKGLFGDIVVEASSLSGLAYYDEFIDEMQAEVPEVQSASPFILTFGILRVPQTDYRQMVQVAGVRLPRQASVTDFAEGLHYQDPDPNTASWDPPLENVRAQLREDNERLRRLLDAAQERLDTGEATAEQAALVMNLRRALYEWHAAGEARLRRAIPLQRELAQVAQELEAAEEAAQGERTVEIEQLEVRLDELIERADFMPPDKRIILGLGIPALSFRTPEGETVRRIVPGWRLELVLVPLGRRVSETDVAPSRGVFTAIDDETTDVSSIDSELVYIPFETLQRLNNMHPVPLVDGGMTPGRTSQIHVKVHPEYSASELELQRIAADIQALWAEFLTRHPDAATSDVTAQTWRQRQQRLIGPIEQQRTLFVTMFGIIAMVAVVLIFVILYTVVVQKTRDIGVLKAIGASGSGVAGVFLAYGATIGLVGSILGAVGGYYFVRYINPIQDAIDAWFGFRVWSREWFLFEKIPNEVQFGPMLVIMLAAMAAGVLGALLPAVVASRMQPVEALRYE